MCGEYSIYLRCYVWNYGNMTAQQGAEVLGQGGKQHSHPVPANVDPHEASAGSIVVSKNPSQEGLFDPDKLSPHRVPRSSKPCLSPQWSYFISRGFSSLCCGARSRLAWESGEIRYGVSFGTRDLGLWKCEVGSGRFRLSWVLSARKASVPEGGVAFGVDLSQDCVITLV